MGRGRGLQRGLAERVGRGYRRWALTRSRGDRAAVLARAGRLVRAKTYCLLVTTGPYGPSARVLEPFRPDAEGRIVLGTDTRSRKVGQIQETGRCLLVYQDDRRRSCVTLECDAEVLSPEASTRFLPMWRAFWPHGPGPDFVNIVCTPTAIELWDGLAVIAPPPFGRTQARIELAPGETLARRR